MFPAAVIPVHTQHYMMLQRNLLYTAITWGRRLVVLMGTSKAAAIATEGGTRRSRYSALRQRVRAQPVSSHRR